jgi:uncharacterized NAD-dependent epimerase/dehydratase family protein
LQHAPARRFFDELDGLGCTIPPIEEEIALIRLLDAEVWAVTLNEEGMAPGDAESHRSRLAEELGTPVLLPLRDNLGELVEIIRGHIDPRGAP